MNPREMNSLETLEKSVKSQYPIPNEPIAALPTLLEIISNIDAKEMQDDKIGPILHDAVSNGHQEIVQALLDAKANPNFKNDRCPVLNSAAYSGHLAIAQALITAKANINSPSREITALHFATIGENIDMIQLLLKEKADPNINPKNGEGALYHAGLIKRPDLIKLLLEGGANPKNTDFDILMSHGYTDLDGNIRDGVTSEQLEKVLSAVNLLLNKGCLLDHPHYLLQFLRVCNQKNPDVLNCFTKLCEHAADFSLDKTKEEFNKIHVFDPAKKYLNKLKVVLQYSYPTPQWNSMFPSIDELQTCDHIGFDRDFPRKITAKEVEKIYDDICRKKYPLWSMLKPFVSTDIKPEEMNDAKSELSYS